MTTIGDTFEELRGVFREETRTRLDEMARCLDALEADPRDGHALRILARHFHGLAGIGATYGYARVSELGELAEVEIANGDVAVERWRELVERMRKEI